MKRAATASVVLHASLLLGGFAILPAAQLAPVAEQVPVVVDISNIAETTAIKATTKQDVPKPPEPKAEQTEVTKDVPPAPKVAEEVVEAAKEKTAEAEPEPEPEPKPEDKPVEDTKLEELLMAQAEAEQKAAEEALALKKKQEAEEKKKQEEAKKKAEDEKKRKEAEAKKKKEDEAKRKKAEEEKKKPKLDFAELEKLLNKENEERTAPKQSSDTSGNPDQGEQEIQGDDAEAKASFRDALVARIRECFRPPPAALDDNIRILVDVDFTLNEDGTLKGVPRPQSSGVPLADKVAEAAASAVVECQPYNFFPPGKYKGFARWVLQFDPRDSRG